MSWVDSSISLCRTGSLWVYELKSSFKSLFNDTLMEASVSPWLKNITTYRFFDSGPPQTYFFPVGSEYYFIFQPCTPKLSWFIAINSSFDKISKLPLSMLLTLHPIRRGALSKHQREKWANDSLYVKFPFPTSSMSGSFQPPISEYFSRPTWS